MLYERTKEAPVDLGNTKIRIDDYPRFIHRKTKDLKVYLAPFQSCRRSLTELHPC
jgi:hypothetical protein